MKVHPLISKRNQIMTQNNGSQQSLQAALNTVEIFGNFSGLKMNKEKTKVIWIGRKKHSKDKLQISEKLDWGKTDFKLLGINFNVDLNNISKIYLIGNQDSLHQWGKLLF